MGIQWWYRPQISWHWPQYTPESRNFIILWEVYPGTQSTLTWAEGIAQECITSLDEARTCSRISVGRAIAPVECSRSIALIPLGIGLNWLIFLLLWNMCVLSVNHRLNGRFSCNETTIGWVVRCTGARGVGCWRGDPKGCRRGLLGVEYNEEGKRLTPYDLVWKLLYKCSRRPRRSTSLGVL